LKRGVCVKINHFPEDTDYDHDSAEYLLRVVRASSIFPILSAILLLLGGVCVAASRVYKSKRNIILGAGILFVAADRIHSQMPGNSSLDHWAFHRDW